MVELVVALGDRRRLLPLAVRLVLVQAPLVQMELPAPQQRRQLAVLAAAAVAVVEQQQAGTAVTGVAAEAAAEAVAQAQPPPGTVAMAAPEGLW